MVGSISEKFVCYFSNHYYIGNIEVTTFRQNTQIEIWIGINIINIWKYCNIVMMFYAVLLSKHIFAEKYQFTAVFLLDQ